MNWVSGLVGNGHLRSLLDAVYGGSDTLRRYAQSKPHQVDVSLVRKREFEVVTFRYALLRTQFDR